MLSSSRQDVAVLRKQDWTLCVIDEVHRIPATHTNRAFQLIKANIKIGLTATPYREDNLIKDLFFVIGPKLHESLTVDLQEENYVSKIYCIQVQVNLSKELKKRYNDLIGERKRKAQIIY